ncbi:hypothetical protein KP509_04G034800 [Ceratopteris richardii]|uniref:PIH1 domain-containing protein 1 n=1 Tax=Ceratopteris richardii TaxID=49495 RepID=A0A8T2V3U0_CERRI|nr:hypothetical protein KP509_04G034800 [Ceratopteris richardii]
MRDPEFMKILSEYAEEISQPLNREESENYIKMVEEQSKGKFSMDGKELVIPIPEFCVKTYNRRTGSKFFINVCHSDKIEAPQSNRRIDGSGVDWHIPFSLSPIHKDKDKGAVDCVDVDYVVNQDVCKRCEKDKKFKRFVAETAIDSVEKHYHLELKREFRLPKLQYKGPTSAPKMLTIPKITAKPSNSHGDPANQAGQDKKDFVEPNGDTNGSECMDGARNGNPKTLKEQEKLSAVVSKVSGEDQLREPKHEIVYKDGLDLGKFWMDKSIDEVGKAKIPKEILLRIFLPEVMNANEVQLDVSDTEVLLVVPGLYKLQVCYFFFVSITGWFSDEC